MIDALSMITGKEYTIRDNRLQEKEEHPELKAKKLITIRFNDKNLDIIKAVQKYGEGEIIRRVNEAIKAYYEDLSKDPMTWDEEIAIYVKPLSDYKKYCVENRLYGMDRKKFFAVLEKDFLFDGE